MGAWGTGPFENDTVSDWWIQLGPNSVKGTLEAAFDAAGGGERIDASMADEALAAIALVAMIVDPTLPWSWVSGKDGGLETMLPDAHNSKALAAACIPIVARSESAELWDGDQEWWVVLHRLATAVGCPDGALEGLGPAFSPRLDGNAGPFAPKEREAMEQLGRSALARMGDHGISGDRRAFDVAHATFFYYATQVNAKAAQENKEKPLEQWIREFSEVSTFDDVWAAAKSRYFWIYRREYETFLSRTNRDHI